MASAINRKARRAQAALDRKVKASVGKPVTFERKTPKVAWRSKLIRDKRISTLIDNYNAASKSSDAMMVYMNGLVQVFAKTADYVDAVEDKAAIQYLIDAERDARVAARESWRQKVSKRDRTGVNTSQFKGVLKLAVSKGGLAIWNRVYATCQNWSLAKDVANTLRTTYVVKKKAVSSKTIEAVRRKRVQRTSGGGKNDGTTNSSAPTLLSRIKDALGKLSKTYRRSLDLPQAEIDKVYTAIGKLELAAKLGAKTAGRKKRIATERKGKLRLVSSK